MAKKSAVPRKRSAVLETDFQPIGDAIDKVIGQLERAEGRQPLHIKLNILFLKGTKLGIEAKCAGRWVIFHSLGHKLPEPGEK